MAVGNASGGGAGELRRDQWLILGEDKDTSVVIVRVSEHIAPKHWDKGATMEPAPGAVGDFAFISGPRKSEVIGRETVISAGIVRPMLETKVGNVMVARVGTYTSRGRKHPCLNPASSIEFDAAMKAIAEAEAAGITFTDADGDTVGDVWLHFEKLNPMPGTDGDDEAPF